MLFFSICYMTIRRCVVVWLAAVVDKGKENMWMITELYNSFRESKIDRKFTKKNSFKIYILSLSRPCAYTRLRVWKSRKAKNRRNGDDLRIGEWTERTRNSFFFSFIWLRETTMMTSRKNSYKFYIHRMSFWCCLACVVWLSRKYVIYQETSTSTRRAHKRMESFWASCRLDRFRFANRSLILGTIQIHLELSCTIQRMKRNGTSRVIHCRRMGELAAHQPCR